MTICKNCGAPVRKLECPTGDQQLVGYARSGTALGLDNQVEALRSAGCGRIFCDHTSGVDTERPAFAELMKGLREGDTVVVVGLERFDRYTHELWDTLDVIGGAGAYVLDLSSDIDTRVPQDASILRARIATARSILDKTRK